MKLFQIALLCIASVSAIELCPKAEQSSLAQVTLEGCGCGPEIPYKTKKNADGSRSEFFKRRGGYVVTTYQNGDIRTDYPTSGDWFRRNADGSTVNYDAEFKETEEIDAEGNETTTYEDGSKYILYADGTFEEFAADGKLVDSGDLT